MILLEELQATKNGEQITLRLTHTKEPVFIEHRDGNNVVGYSWHPIQTRLHDNLRVSSEFAANRIEGPWDTVEAARNAASEHYERAAMANFKDKIPNAVQSTIHYDVEPRTAYQEVHYLDPDSRDVIVTAYKEDGRIDGRCVKPHTVNSEYIKDMDPSEVAKHTGDPYDVAVGIHALTANKPYAIKLHANDAHSVYKTAKDPEEASALHEKTLLAAHKNSRIKRHTPTAFELYRRNGGVIHSFTVPGQIHEIDGGQLNVAEGSLTAHKP